MKKTVITALCLLLITSLYSLTGEEIMERVINTQKVTSSAMDIQMTLIDKTSESSIRRIQTLVLKEGDETKTITLFLSPARVKNTRFLTISRENGPQDQWIYLPALDKVKRIAAGEQEGSFMGSDFSYSDMSTLGLEDDSHHRLIGEEIYRDLNCYVVESIPGSEIESAYGKTVTWVDKATWLTPKVEFYSKEDRELVKELTCREFAQEHDRWLAKKITMKTISDEHETELEILQVKYDISLPSGYFTTTFLETGRSR